MIARKEKSANCRLFLYFQFYFDVFQFYSIRFLILFFFYFKFHSTFPNILQLFPAIRLLRKKINPKAQFTRKSQKAVLFIFIKFRLQIAKTFFKTTFDKLSRICYNIKVEQPQRVESRRFYALFCFGAVFRQLFSDKDSAKYIGGLFYEPRAIRTIFGNREDFKADAEIFDPLRALLTCQRALQHR